MEKAKIQNPLTIIAIFAGIAEVTGTTVLLGLPLEIQKIFVWFTIGFPIMLVVSFFLLLTFKHKVLYAPSDFRDENNFVELINSQKAKFDELNNLFEEVKHEPEISSNPKVKETLDVIEKTLEEANKESKKYSYYVQAASRIQRGNSR